MKETVDEIASLLSVSLPEKKKQSSPLYLSQAVFDSRKVERGALFFALKGEKHDGHDFLREIASLGAGAAVVERSQLSRLPTLPFLTLLPVNSPRESLYRLAQKIFPQKQCRVLAVSGSFGKSTTKEFLYQMLSPYRKVEKSPGNYNTDISLPTILLNCTRESWLILEMGVRRKGDMARLVSLAPPEIALLTQVGQAHAEHFADERELVEEKATLLFHEKTSHAIFPRDLPHLETLLPRICAHPLSFNCQPDQGAFSPEKSLWQADQSLYSVRLRLPFDQKTQLSFSIPHEAFLRNGLAALITAHAAGLTWEQIRAQTTGLRLPPHRLQLRRGRGGVTFIDDSYNHATLQGARVALDLLRRRGKGARKIALLSEMREQGTQSAENHRQLALLALRCADLLLYLGEPATIEIMDRIWHKKRSSLLYFLERELFFAQALSLFASGDWILVKGARCYALEELIEEWENFSFSTREKGGAS